MACSVEFAESSFRQLKKLDPQGARRITGLLRDRVAASKDPRLLGEALRGAEFGGLWKYRVGDYRIVADSQDQRVRILVVRLGHRREVYR